MKVVVKDKYLNVRHGAPSVNAPCYQYLAPGSEIEVDGKLYKGDVYGDSGIDTWLKDAAGNYYWSGGVAGEFDIQEKLKKSIPFDAGRTNFSWFSRMGISEVWHRHQEKGKQTKIAILDTGYNRRNSELKEAVVDEKIIITKEEYPGLDLIIDDQSSDGHGSRCLSLVGARNKKQWNIGVAPEAKVLVGKISIDTEIRNFDFILRGIKWAIDQGADVISISYSVKLDDLEKNRYEKKFQELIRDNSVLVFAAAGNSSGTLMRGERYPASFEGCISVGATNSDNSLSLKTIISDKTIIHAPGIDIESFGQENSPTAISGTSFSTPIVAGIVGMAVSKLKSKGHKIEREKMISLILSTAHAIPGQNNKKVINAINLLQAI